MVRGNEPIISHGAVGRLGALLSAWAQPEVHDLEGLTHVWSLVGWLV